MPPCAHLAFQLGRKRFAVAQFVTTPASFISESINRHFWMIKRRQITTRKKVLQYTIFKLENARETSLFNANKKRKNDFPLGCSHPLI